MVPARKTMSPNMRRCMHCARNVVTVCGSVHFSTGCGGCHRSFPTGGAANGIPLKTRKPSCSATPTTGPLVVCTGGGAGGAWPDRTHRSAAAEAMLFMRGSIALPFSRRRRYRVGMRRLSFVGPAASAVALALFVSACERPSPPAQSSQPGAPAATPSAAPAARGSQVYVSDETGGVIAVIDPDRREVIRKIEVGKRPRGSRVSPDGTKLYVALSGSPIGGPGVDESKLPPADRAADGIGVIDLASGAVVRKYQSGS